jgi:WD40 repeat protein
VKIYILSAGISQQQDYIWQEITETGEKPVDEPIWVSKFKQLLDTQAHSIFIGRKSNENKLILLVTGMKASERKDYKNRTIRNSIALIAEDNQKNEQKIRGIAVLALKEELDREIDCAVKKGGELGFEVDYAGIKNIIDKASLHTDSTSAGTEHLMIGKNSPDNIEKIINELEKCRLPQNKDSEILVVVTEIKAEDVLKQAEVWRGLSNLVEKEELTKYEPPNSNQNFLSNGEANAEFMQRLILIIGVIGITGLIIYIFSQFFFKVDANKPKQFTVAAVSPGGNYIASASPDAQIIVQNTQNKQEYSINNNAPIESVAISSDGNYVVTGNKKGNVELWDVTSKKKLK